MPLTPCWSAAFGVRSSLTFEETNEGLDAPTRKIAPFSVALYWPGPLPRSQNDPTALPSTITTASASRPPTIDTITMSM